MATTLSNNLKLRISSDLTSDAIYNLNKIDTLGQTSLIDPVTGTLKLKSVGNIRLTPESSDLGGAGQGGIVAIGSDGLPIDNLDIYSNLLTFNSSVFRFSDGSNQLDLTFPVTDGTAGQALVTDGSGQLSWTSLTITDIMDADVAANAAISLSKLASITANRVVTSNGSGVMTASSVTTTELSYLSGVTSNIQTQINALGGANQLVDTWVSGDGLTKTITHNFGTRNIIVQVLNSDSDYSTIDVESVTRPTDNTVVLTSTELPGSSWTVLLTQIGS